MLCRCPLHTKGLLPRECHPHFTTHSATSSADPIQPCPAVSQPQQGTVPPAATQDSPPGSGPPPRPFAPRGSGSPRVRPGQGHLQPRQRLSHADRVRHQLPLPKEVAVKLGVHHGGGAKVGEAAVQLSICVGEGSTERWHGVAWKKGMTSPPPCRAAGRGPARTGLGEDCGAPFSTHQWCWGWSPEGSPPPPQAWPQRRPGLPQLLHTPEGQTMYRDGCKYNRALWCVGYPHPLSDGMSLGTGPPRMPVHTHLPPFLPPRCILHSNIHP